MSNQNLNLFSFSGNIKILHLTWVAFFISFVVWFNHAPLMVAIQQQMGLSDQQVKTLLILNVALTIPARIIVGMLVDKYGPKILYTLLLSFASVPCFMFAMADNFEDLAFARFLLGGVGAGFVIGIRLIGEWFSAKQVGLAEGIYGGWGNFGAAAAAMVLPLLALAFGGEQGWRYAVAFTGAIALVYAFVFYRNVHDTPKGSTYFKPKKSGAMEVTSKADMVFYIVMQLPMYLALGLLAWKLSPSGVSLLNQSTTTLIFLGLTILYLYNVYKIYHLNIEHLQTPVPELHRYKFKQVAAMNVAYFATFGAELAVVSMLPLFFFATFKISMVAAGLFAGTFAFMNLVARPAGGLISDKFGRKKTLSICIIGLALGFVSMSQIDSTWPLAIAVICTVITSFFVQAGAGAVFAIVPLIRRRMTGQIAGMAGAYGNVGGVVFLTVLSVTTPEIFFLVIAGAGLAALALVQFMDEPKGAMAEILPDGTVQMIEVA